MQASSTFNCRVNRRVSRTLWGMSQEKQWMLLSFQPLDWNPIRSFSAYSGVFAPGIAPDTHHTVTPCCVCACTSYTRCMQYTIRGIPPKVNNALRARARAADKSLNEAAITALAEGTGVTGGDRKRRNLADIAGTWRPARAVDSAFTAQDGVDKDLWR